MGRCIAKIEHSCGSSDGLQIFEKDNGLIDGYCFPCDTFVLNPLGEGKTIEDIPNRIRIRKTDDEIRNEIEVIHNYDSVDLVQRRLRALDLDSFRVRVSLSEQDGKTPIIVHFPYTKDLEFSSYKNVLLNPKKMWSIGDQTDVDLFGWVEAVASGAKRLIITEGEFDAVALRKILHQYTKENFQDFIPAVCSLPHGAGSAARDLSRLLPSIRKHFREISLCFDNDKPGKRATEEVCKICPEATVITLPRKDANDCILQGCGKAAHKAATFNAVKNKNTSLVWGHELHEAAKGQAVWGVSWPWESMTDITRGIRKGETIYIGAAQKMGKSEVVDSIAAHLIKEHGWKVLLAKPEQANKRSYKMLASKIVSRIFHDPKVVFDEEAYERAGNIIKDKCCFLDLYQHLSWQTLELDIRAAASQGVDAVFIDPITNLTNGMSMTDINSSLQGIAQDLAAIAMDLDLAIFIFCHVKKPGQGCTPFDRGGKITTADFAGSSGMGRSCNYTLALEGDRDPDLPVAEQNLRDLVLLDDREFGETLRMHMRWARQSGQFGEI